MKNFFDKKTAIIFDFDGTIAETVSLHEAAFRQALIDYGVDFDYGDYIGMSTAKAIELIFRKNNRGLSEAELTYLVREKRKLANISYQHGLKALPDALDFIELAYLHKMQLFIGSSGSAMNVLAGVRALNIEQYFTGIITADDVKNSKPDPEIFLNILQTFDIDAEKAIVIEDADSGVEAACMAGIEVVCVNPEGIRRIENTLHSEPISFSQLIKEFELHIQHEKSIGCGRHL